MKRTKGSLIPEDSVIPIRKSAPTPRKQAPKAEPVSKRGRKARAGDVLFNPDTFTRQSYPVHNFTAFALSIMAKRRKVTTGILVNYILTRAALDHLDEVPTIDHGNKPTPDEIPGGEILKDFLRE